MRWFLDLVQADALTPHGFCLLWQPELIWASLLSDGLTALSYYSIPVVLSVLVYKRRRLAVAYRWTLTLFALFIAACGTTHLFQIITLFTPAYVAEIAIKMVTAGLSVGTAISLWPLLPKLLAIPAPEELQQRNRELTAANAELANALKALHEETCHRLAAEERLRNAHKMEAVSQLTAGIAHDINNLLTVVSGNLERIIRYREQPQKAAEAATSAMEGVDRVAHVVVQLLSYGRRATMHATPHHVGPLIAGFVAALRNVLGENITISLTTEETCEPALLDEFLFQNAFLNLMLNARDAMPQGGRIEITVRCPDAADWTDDARPGDYLVVEIVDTGCGMDPETLAKSFDPYFTTKGIGQGLGLSQVYGFAHQSQGHVTLSSVPTKGTIARLFLPKVGAAAHA